MLYRLNISKKTGPNETRIVLNFPDEETVQRYMNFGEEGVNLVEVLMSLTGDLSTVLGWTLIGLNDLTNEDSVISYHHVKED